MNQAKQDMMHMAIHGGHNVDSLVGYYRDQID